MDKKARVKSLLSKLDDKENPPSHAEVQQITAEAISMASSWLADILNQENVPAENRIIQIAMWALILGQLKTEMTEPEIDEIYRKVKQGVEIQKGAYVPAPTGYMVH